MKTQFLSLVFLLICASLSAQEVSAKFISENNVVEPSAAVDNGMRWDNTTHDFGSIERGVPKTAEFVVHNSSKEPLIIEEVKSTCGCTAAHHDKGPILPGESSVVTATYNAKNAGAFRKSIKVMTNKTESPILLTVTGTVSE